MRRMDKAIIWFLIYVSSSALFIYIETSTLKSLPSPIHGGDYYYQLGCINHIMHGGNILSSSTIEDSIPGYLPLYGGFVALLGKITGSSALKAMFLSVPIVFILSSLVLFIFLTELLNDRLAALLGTVVLNPLYLHPVFKYTDFTRLVMIPLFLLFAFRVMCIGKERDYLTLGIITGLLSLSHFVFYIGAVCFSVVIVSYKLGFCDKVKGVRKCIYFIVPLIFLSLLYWYKPLFVYKLKITYDRLHIDLPDFARNDVAWSFFKAEATRIFLDFSNLANSFLTLMFWIGIWFILRKPGCIENFLKIGLAIFVILTFSYFLTEPLFGQNLVPTYMRTYIYVFKSLISIYSITKITNIISKKTKFKIKHDYILLVIAALLSFTFAKSFTLKFDNNVWFKIGKKEIPEIYKLSADFVAKNSDINTVILTTKEVGFAINALTGRKLITSRWAHQANPYVDFPHRDIDVALILYGDNDTLREALLRKYKVSYLYWNYYWITSEFRLNRNGKIVSFYDPLMAFYKYDIVEILRRNGIKFFRIHWWADPSSWREEVRRFDLIVISPANYRNFYKPWNEKLDKYLEKVWSIQDSRGHMLAAFYKVKY